MSSPGNQDCANCIGTLSLPIVYRHCSELRRLVVNTCIPTELFTLELIRKLQLANCNSVQFMWRERGFG